MNKNQYTSSKILIDCLYSDVVWVMGIRCRSLIAYYPACQIITLSTTSLLLALPNQQLYFSHAKVINQFGLLYMKTLFMDFYSIVSLIFTFSQKHYKHAALIIPKSSIPRTPTDKENCRYLKPPVPLWTWIRSSSLALLMSARCCMHPAWVFCKL